MQILNINQSTHFIQKPLFGSGDLFIYSLKKRWIPEISEIEHYSNETFWRKRNFIKLLKQPNILGYVIVKLRKVVGFVLYQMNEEQIDILNLCVHPEYQKQGIGSRLINKLISNHYRSKIVFEIREHNIEAQKFLKKNGFIVNGVLKNHFQDHWPDGTSNIEDGYIFRYYEE